MLKSPTKFPALMNITTLSKYLGIGRTCCYDWLHTQQLPPAAKIINGRRYWTIHQIEQFLEEKSK